MKLLKKIIIALLLLVVGAVAYVGYYYVTHDEVVSPQKYMESLILKNKVYEKDLVQKEGVSFTTMGKWNYFKSELNCNTDKYIKAYRLGAIDYKKCTDKETLEYSPDLSYSTDKLDRLIDDANAFDRYVSSGDFEKNKFKVNTPEEVFTFLIEGHDVVKSLYSDMQSGKLRTNDKFFVSQITCDFVNASKAKEENKPFKNCDSYDVFKYYKTERYMTLLRKLASI